MKALARLAVMMCVLAGCVGCDQVSKAVARAYLPGTGVHSYLGDTLWSVLSRRLEWPHRLCIGVIGASGAANIIDRIRFDGAVTDFLNLGLGSVRTGIFSE